MRDGLSAHLTTDGAGPIFRQTQRVTNMTRREKVVELFVEKPQGTVVSYEEVAERLGLQPANDRLKIQKAVLKSARLLRRHSRRDETIHGVGYYVIEDA